MDSYKLIIGIFVTVIFGVILVGVLADRESLTDVIWSAAEQDNITDDRDAGFVSPTSFYLETHTDGKQIRSLSVQLANGTALTENTDYIIVDRYDDNPYIYYLASTDILQSAGSAELSNMTNITYNYHDGGYIDNGTARTLLSLVILFFVLGIAIFVIGGVIGWDKFRNLIGRI